MMQVNFQQRAGQPQMQPMPNIRGVAPNVMANTIPNSMLNQMNANNMNMNMGLYEMKMIK